MQVTTITAALREALMNDPRSFLKVSKLIGVERCSLVDFAIGVTSLHLVRADKVAKFYGLGFVKGETLTQTIRRVLQDDPRPWHFVSQHIGHDHSGLARFGRGKVSLRLSAADRIAKLYGLKLKKTHLAK